MHVQISRVKIAGGRIQEATQLFRESVLPVVVEQPGFIKFYLFSDPTQDELIIESFWDTSEDIEALQVSGFYQQQVGKFGAIFAAPPERRVFTVALEY